MYTLTTKYVVIACCTIIYYLILIVYTFCISPRDKKTESSQQRQPSPSETSRYNDVPPSMRKDAPQTSTAARPPGRIWVGNMIDKNALRKELKLQSDSLAAHVEARKRSLDIYRN